MVKEFIYKFKYQDIITTWTYQAHILSDASELAYGSVAYLKLVFTDGHQH